MYFVVLLVMRTSPYLHLIDKEQPKHVIQLQTFDLRKEFFPYQAKKGMSKLSVSDRRWRLRGAWAPAGSVGTSDGRWCLRGAWAPQMGIGICGECGHLHSSELEGPLQHRLSRAVPQCTFHRNREQR